MPGGEHASSDAALHCGWEGQQSDRVRDGGTRTSQACGELLLRDPEVLEELLVRGGLLERVELDAMDVLDQRFLEEVGVLRRSHDGGHGRQAGDHRRAQSTLAGDELVAVRTQRAHDERLEHADVEQARGELVDVLLVEHVARLARVAGDSGRVDLDQTDPADTDR